MKDKTINSSNLANIRQKLNNKQGKAYWRSLEELADTEEFQQYLQNEFPSTPFEGGSGLDRRRFLQLMGASMAFAGLNACTLQPKEVILPYVQAPEEMLPGKPLYFASTFCLGGYGTGVLVESHDGRPTKIEGNPDHPSSLGATDIFAQASVLELYDPDRAQIIKNVGRVDTWENLLAVIKTELEAQKVSDGAGVRILTETVTSPTLASQIQNFLKNYPLAKWHQYEPVGRDNFKKGSQLAFGENVDCQYDFEKADVVLSLDADFFSHIPGSLVYSRQFSSRRKVNHDHVNMNRLYAVESSPSLAGTMADHRLVFRAGQIPAFAAAVAKELGVNVNAPEDFSEKKTWISALVRDLRKNSGKSIVIAGEHQPAEVHYLAHVINAVLGNVGETVKYTKSVEAKPIAQFDSIAELAVDMAADSVDFLVVLGGNPVFDAPANLRFSEKMGRVKTRLHLSLHENETSELCHWFVPASHYLESWSDARAFDGTASIVQPLIAPLYATKSVHELLAALNDNGGKSGHDLVQDYWKNQLPSGAFEKSWRKALHDGLIAGSRYAEKSVRVKKNVNLKIEKSANALEFIFRPDPSIWDGRYANVGWLQELPKPLSKLTWDNAALVSPATAEEQGWENGNVVKVSSGEAHVEMPIWILPGHPNNSITGYLGYGRTISGEIARGAGVNINPLRTGSTPWNIDNVTVEKSDRNYSLAGTQDHGSMEGRHLVRQADLKEYVENPNLIHEMGHDPDPELTLYPPFEYNGYSWGMVVDLNSCTGCNACTIACQSENNIAVVGKEEVLNGREMHWIRVDRYYEGDIDEPEAHHQPVMCMHCENAPCEVVCPVAATTHSDEGLNEMTYNRCVGTRYCANNCPYKVRRFNFYKYSDYETESLKLQRNPDVTVRFRGVMEKCSYCVQRINSARIDSKKDERQIADGEILTACQQVCPSDAIIFGNINDPESHVAKLKAEHRNYGILTELGVKPRTSYLAKIKNPNPELA